MKLYRITAILKKHLLLSIRDYHRIIDLIYWPLLDMVVWGYFGLWMQKSTPGAQGIALRLSLLTAIVFWQLLFRTYMDMAFGLLDELWSRNFVNLFVTPLQRREWLAALMLLGIIKMSFAFALGAAVGQFLYGLNILSLGWYLIPCITLLMLSGWWIGLFITGSVIYWGPRIQSFVFMTGYLFMPFSAVYYPVATLEPIIQKISYALPMTYIFEGMRTFFFTGVFPVQYFIYSAVLTALYLMLASCAFIILFRKSYERGLAQLETDV